MKQRPALVIFARAPLAGKTKTRLIPALGPSGAAELYEQFLLDTLSQAAGLPADVLVAAADPSQAGAIQMAMARAGLEAPVIGQSGRDLGERMANATGEALARGAAGAVVIGSDSPSLPPERVASALSLLPERDVVLGPCLDGGYYLIGQRRLLPELFQGVEWGGRDVLAQTVRRARSIGASVALLEPWYDVDTPEDLALLRSHLTALALAGAPIPCPRTWEFLHERA